MPITLRRMLPYLLIFMSVSFFSVSAYSRTVVTPHTFKIASGSAMVVDLQTHQVLYSLNPKRVRPIASLTKLMTVMVAMDAHQSPNELLSVDISHDPDMKGVYSRVRLHSKLSREKLMLLALMSSENRAAATLAHHYPGGYYAFMKAMNNKAKALGMKNTFYAEPTGLSHNNISNASDLIKLIEAAGQYPKLMSMSHTKQTSVTFRDPTYTLPFRNTNHLVYNAHWQVDLTKTGFTNEAGHCLIMRTWINKRPVALVLMDAFGKYTHFADANRLRRYLETGKVSPIAASALQYRADNAS